MSVFIQCTLWNFVCLTSACKFLKKEVNKRAKQNIEAAEGAQNILMLLKNRRTRLRLKEIKRIE